MKGLNHASDPVENNDRMSLRIASKEKSLLLRAAALQHVNLTEFVIRNAVAVAHKVIDENKRLQLAEKIVCARLIYWTIRRRPTINCWLRRLLCRNDNDVAELARGAH